MTNLFGEIPLIRERDRLLEPLNDLCILLEGITVSCAYHLLGQAQFDDGDFAAATCNCFDLEVRLPIKGPVEAALKEQIPKEIRLKIVKKRSSKNTDEFTSGLRSALVRVYSPIFVDFFENNRPKVVAIHGSDPNGWPSIWNFARVIRNACAHGGRLNISNPLAPSVSWHGVTYAASDNGRQVVGKDLSFGDFIILLLELSAQLDADGASF